MVVPRGGVTSTLRFSNSPAASSAYDDSKPHAETFSMNASAGPKTDRQRQFKDPVRGCEIRKQLP